MIDIESVNIWSRIKRINGQSHKKSAAVAYVSDDSIIEFKRGDLLITDASDSQIQSGATSSKVLSEALKRGAEIYSYRNLHGKLMLFYQKNKTTMINGSVNISTSSEVRLTEVAIFSDSKNLCKNAETIINSLKNSKNALKIDANFIKRISKIKFEKRLAIGSTRKLFSQKENILDIITKNPSQLDDFRFMIFHYGSKLNKKEVKEEAKKKGIFIPQNSSKWDVFEMYANPSKKFENLIIKREFKIIRLGVELNKGRNSIQEFVFDKESVLIYSNMVKVKSKVAIIHSYDPHPGFNIDRKLIEKLNNALKINSKLGKTLFKKYEKEDLLTASELTKIIE